MNNDFWSGTDATFLENQNAPSDFWSGTDATPIQNNTPETTSSPTFTDRAKEFGQGVVRSVGATADTVNKFVAAPVAHVAGVAAQNAGKFFNTVGLDTIGDAATNLGNKTKHLGWQYENSNATEELPKSKFLQTSVDPDTTSKILTGAGQGLGELPGFALGTKGVQLLTTAGKGVKPLWIKNINKFLETPVTAKNAAIFAGMGAGQEMAKSNDPNVGEVEQVAREIGGAMLGGLSVDATYSSTAKGLSKVFLNYKDYLNPAKAYKEGKFIKKYGGEINEDVVASAKELGLPLTPDLISNNPMAVSLVNNKLQSQFVDAGYKETMDNLPATLIQKLEDTVLDTIGSKVEGSSTESAAAIVSREAHDAMSNNIKEWKATSRQLYDQAKAIATEDMVVPTEQALQKMRTLAEDLQYGSKNINTDKARVLKTLKEFEESSKSNQGMKVRDLIGWKQDFSNTGTTGEGYEKLYNSMAHVIEQDIENFIASGNGNKEFVETWKIATDYNKQNVQNIIKTDAVRKILQGKLPVEATKYMTNKRAVGEVEKIINNPELMGKLKRTAFELQLSNRNIINSNGDLNAIAFNKLIKKDKDFVVSLIGEKNYKTVNDSFSPYLNQLSKKELTNNPSRTAYVSKDQRLQEESENLIPKSLWAGAIGAASGATGGLLAAGGHGAGIGAVGLGVSAATATLTKGVLAKREISAIKQLSKMANDSVLMEKIIKRAREPKGNGQLNNAINSPATKYQTINFGAKAMPWLGQSPLDKEEK